MRRALISGTTSGTAGSVRKAELLSTTTAPAFTAMGAYCLEMPLPAQNKAMSTPAKAPSVSASTVSSRPRTICVLPADLGEASSFSEASGMPRLSMQPINSRPTAPVAPTMATFLFFTSYLLQAIKKPRPVGGGAWVFRDLSALSARDPSPGFEGLAGLGGALGHVHGAGTYGAITPSSTALSV